MIIALDVDDVLVNTHPYILNHLNRKFDTNFTTQDCTMYQIQELWGKKKEEAQNELYKFMREEGEYLPAIKGAREVISFFVEMGDEVIAVTAREEIEEQTQRCLDREFDKNIEQVYFAGLNGENRESKYQVISRIKAGLYVDDRTDFVLQCNGFGGRVLLYRQKWNESEVIPSKIGTVLDWNEILDERKKLGF